MPFREKGVPTGLQIQSFQGERNPYNHTEQDTIAHMNLDYWLEQIKATVAIAAHLAGPIGTEGTPTSTVSPTATATPDPTYTATPTEAATAAATSTSTPTLGAGLGIYLPMIIITE